MYLLMINLTMGMLLLMCPCAIFGQDAIDAEIRDEMMALHPDVRMPGLAAIRRNHNLSDDEFSERLVKLATVTTNGDDATLRMFTVAALGDFGTTNALDFLEKEVRRGNVGAISEYGAISGYDDTFWRLATLMTSDLGKPNYRCRFTVYCAMRPILKDESYYGKPIDFNAKRRGEAFLLAAAYRDRTWTDFIDQILCDSISEYRTSTTRLEVAKSVLTDPEATELAIAHYQTEMTKLAESHARGKLVKDSSLVQLQLCFVVGCIIILGLSLVFVLLRNRSQANRVSTHH